MSDGDKTANLRKPKTAKETAKRLGISERQLYKACASEILRWGRSDLMEKVQAGEMSIHAAWLQARGEGMSIHAASGEGKETSWDRLASMEQRDRGGPRPIA